MAEQITAFSIVANQTFTDLVSLANTLVNKLATVTMTTDATTNGAVTTGNGYVSGVLGATTITALNWRGGTVANSANLNLISNLIVTNANTIIKHGQTTVNSTY